MRKANKTATSPVAAAKASKAKAANKPAAAPVAVAKPAVPAASEQRAARTALTHESHAFAAKLYAGASKPVHSGKPGKLADYIDRAKRQPQAVGTSGTSDRDHVLLARIAVAVPGIAKAGGSFDPSAPNIAADLGVISRLASAGYVAVSGNGLVLTPAGAERTRLVTKAA